MKRLLLLSAVVLLPAGTCDGNINDNSFFLTTTFRVSISTERVEGNSRSGTVGAVALQDNRVSISADGRYVAFDSQSNNLVSGDTNGLSDVFVHDTLTGTTERVSVADNESQAAGLPSAIGSYRPQISDDGRYVIFESDATNLIGPGADTNTNVDVFRRDRETGTTIRVSVTDAGGQILRGGYQGSMSANGDIIAFVTLEAIDALDTDPILTPRADVYVRSVSLGTTVLASIPDLSPKPVMNSGFPAVSGNGLVVVFESEGMLEAADTDGLEDIYARVLPAGPTVMISRSTLGLDANGDCFRPAVNFDGRYVVFESEATNLVPDDDNAVQDIFIRDTVGIQTGRISQNTAKIQGNRVSYAPAISGDGRYVVYHSDSTNLASPDENDKKDVFIRDLLAARTLRLSVRTYGDEANDDSVAPSISRDGRFVAFPSFASDLSDDDVNGVSDVFVRGPLY